MAHTRIGIDLGGTKIEGVALAGDGQELLRQRLATPRDDYDGTLDAIVSLVARIEGRTGPAASVGICIPGTISPATGLVKNANSVWLIGKPLDCDLTRRLERPIRLANDANCFALSEAIDGAAQGAETVFGVILGTGVGGAIVHRGRLISGHNAIAGEWGHNPLPWPEDHERPGPECYCGRTGCIETFLSGPGLARDHLAHTAETLAPDTIAARAEAGDARAEATLQRYEHRLARGLATIINTLDPACIVLGGGLSNLSRLYRNVPDRWAPFVFSDSVETRLVPPTHGDSSGVRGAARLWPSTPDQSVGDC